MAFDTNTASRWLFRIKDENGDLVANLVKARRKSIKVGLNRAGEASFEYSLKELDALASSIGSTVPAILGIGRHVLECVRDGTVYFAGQILIHIRKSASADATVFVKAMGFFWLLSTRNAGLTTDRVFTEVDAGLIAWTLIDETQDLTNGDFGITQGELQTSLDRTITYTRKNIKDAIEDLAFADGGFDFEVDENKVFNIFYPNKGSDKSSIVIFRYPGPQIQSISEEKDGTEMVNACLTVGRGWGDDEISAQREDLPSQESINRRERIVSVKDIDNATVLGDIAQEVVNQLRSVNPIFRIDYNDNTKGPDLSSFVVGDFITLKISEDFWIDEQILRVFEINILVDDGDREKVKLVVGII